MCLIFRIVTSSTWTFKMVPTTQKGHSAACANNGRVSAFSEKVPPGNMIVRRVFEGMHQVVLDIDTSRQNLERRRKNNNLVPDLPCRFLCFGGSLLFCPKTKPPDLFSTPIYIYIYPPPPELPHWKRHEQAKLISKTNKLETIQIQKIPGSSI